MGTGHLNQKITQRSTSKPELCQYCFNQRELANVTDAGEVVMIACPRCSPEVIQNARQEIQARAALDQAVATIEKFTQKRIDVRGLRGIFKGEKIS